MIMTQTQILFVENSASLILKNLLNIRHRKKADMNMRFFL